VPRWDDVRTFPPVADADGERWERSRPEQSERAPDSIGERGTRSWSVDLICGGFPCQDISFAGKGAGLAGERSGLWYEFARVVRVIRPRYVLVENVAALLVRGLDAVLGTLASDGYDAEWFCLPAAAVGAPHRRDRVFIVAHAADVRREQLPAFAGSAGASENQGWMRQPARAGNGADAHRRRFPQQPERHGDPRPGFAAQQRHDLERHRLSRGVEQWGADPADDPESGVGRVASRVSHRVDRLRGLGNAVVPQVAQFIGERIVEWDSARTPEHD
jgi:DNA (cytosine-5)-methyltransferase 1